MYDSSKVKSAEITAEIMFFVIFTVSSYYDSLLHYKNYILQSGDVLYRKSKSDWMAPRRKLMSLIGHSVWPVCPLENNQTNNKSIIRGSNAILCGGWPPAPLWWSSTMKGVPSCAPAAENVIETNSIVNYTVILTILVQLYTWLTFCNPAIVRRILSRTVWETIADQDVLCNWTYSNITFNLGRIRRIIIECLKKR